MGSQTALLITCTNCNHQKICSVEEIIPKSNQQEFSTPEKARDYVATQLLQKFKCSHCGSKNAKVSIPKDPEADFRDFDPVTVCIKCEKPIPKERLQAVPNATRCVKCQEAKEQGIEDKPKPVFCPECGSVMVWRQRRQPPANYFLGCSNYPKCTHLIAGSW